MEVSKLSFSQEFGPKLREDYVMVKHLSRTPKEEAYARCCLCHWTGCCNSKWQKVNALASIGISMNMCKLVRHSFCSSGGSKSTQLVFYKVNELTVDLF